MTRKQKKFIRLKLIPFILRENGNGFGMSQWLFTGATPGRKTIADMIERPVPVCGTVGCIGGSIMFLNGMPYSRLNTAAAAKFIGLGHRKAYALFYGWQVTCQGRRWPKKYQLAYAAAMTPKDKAGVAADLLDEVAETNGECLIVKIGEK